MFGPDFGVIEHKYNDMDIISVLKDLFLKVLIQYKFKC